MHRAVLRLATVLPVLAPAAAAAHPGHAGAGVIHGLMHPLSGADHIIAMVAVGVMAARLGGPALWRVPASFVAAMTVAGLAASSGVTLPYMETGIAVSVVVLAAVAMFGVVMPVAAAMGLVALFAAFHGYAHGLEMPETASGLAYGVGFVAATAALHVVGIGVGLLIGAGPPQHGRRGLSASRPDYDQLGRVSGAGRPGRILYETQRVSLLAAVPVGGRQSGAGRQPCADPKGDQRSLLKLNSALFAYAMRQ
jgi:urease accessory protein